MADDLDRACAQVGRFLYHFANLEHEIDRAIAKLLELSPGASNVITGSVDFLKRFNFMRTAVLWQAKDSERGEVEKILNKVFGHNDDRLVMAHSQFEPVGDGVKFTRVVARGGKVEIPDETWFKKDFEDKYSAMQTLGEQLVEIVSTVKPTNYVLRARTGDYAAWFAQGSPHALLHSAPSKSLDEFGGAENGPGSLR
jgi:hypothetical protein